MQANNSSNKNAQAVNLVDLLVYLASKWKWFLVSVLVCVGIAWYKYARAPFVYFRSATIIIKDPSNKTSTTSLDRFDNIINKTNVANEILQFQSKQLMEEVVQRVHADVSYQIEDGLRTNELYTQSPMLIRFLDVMPEQAISFVMTPKDRNTIELTDIAGCDAKQPSYTVHVNDTVTLAKGVRIVASRTNFYNTSWNGQDIQVRKQPLSATVAYYRSSLGIKQEDEESFSAFLDRHEYDEAENYLFLMVRLAFSAGWQAAGGQPPVSEKIYQLLPSPAGEEQGGKE